MSGLMGEPGSAGLWRQGEASLTGGNPDAARAVLAFCGLDWHPECIDFESNTTPVSTASIAQVRQPIHRRAVDSWRRYAVPLEPLRRRLATDGWIPA